MGPAGRQGGGFRLVVDALYSEVTDAGKGVSVPFTFDSKIIEQALRNIRSRKVNTRRQIDPGLFSEVNRIMQQAVTEGYEDPDGDSGFVRQIRNNTEVFAAFKAHRMGRDMASQLLDENGQVKSFQQFRKDTEDIVDHHVNAWLRAEYDTAVKRAHKAEEMRQFMDEADVFPNIEWLPSTAVHRREAHIPFYHHIWPVDDPFWDAHKPGDEWGCQCGWSSTDEPVTDNRGLADPDSAPVSPGLGGNPAKTGELFTDDHPYFPSYCAHCGFYKPGIRNRFKYLFTAREKDCYNCPFARQCINDIPDEDRKRRNRTVYESLKEDKEYMDVRYNKSSGGVKGSHVEHNFDERGGKYEKTAQDVGYKSGHAVIFEKEGGSTIGQRFTEGTWDGMKCEISGAETGTDNNILRSLEHCADKRTTEVAILVFPKGGFAFEKVRRALGRYRGLEKLEDGEYIPFKRVICIQNGEIVYDEPF